MVFGERWCEKPNVVASKSGFVDVFRRRKSGSLFTILQPRDCKGSALPSPEIIFRFDRRSPKLAAISWEDYFALDGYRS